VDSRNYEVAKRGQPGALTGPTKPLLRRYRNTQMEPDFKPGSIFRSGPRFLREIRGPVGDNGVSLIYSGHDGALDV